ncbi:hypothetical protein SKAU_G00390030 [Synaphobranchus kaupii]|uniref:Uncharacterized protein n=1 Tax=Synaphobranchus kaupii TaxID=118154 RepID=A0A9Q1EBD9_SYNKA|nr:hypothetical protein SKAU_G00390030 [Synaphobranchus kaupii]
MPSQLGGGKVTHFNEEESCVLLRGKAVLASVEFQGSRKDGRRPALFGGIVNMCQGASLNRELFVVLITCASPGDRTEGKRSSVCLPVKLAAQFTLRALLRPTRPLMPKVGSASMAMKARPVKSTVTEAGARNLWTGESGPRSQRFNDRDQPSSCKPLPASG